MSLFEFIRFMVNIALLQHLNFPNIMNVSANAVIVSDFDYMIIVAQIIHCNNNI